MRTMTMTEPRPSLLPAVLLAVSLPLTMALAVEPAQADTPTVTVYTYDSFTADWGPGPAIEKAFEAECGCDLVLIGLDSSVGILTRLRLEGDSASADVALGLDQFWLDDAKSTGLFVEHGVDTGRLDLPGGWTDPVFLPFDYGFFAFVHDTTKLPVPPSSLRDLVERPDGPTVVIQDPRSSTPGMGLLAWMQAVYGQGAEGAWMGLAPRIVSATKDWSEAYGLFLEGEADMVLSYTTSPAYHRIAESDPRFAAARFSEGHVMQIETAALLRAAPNPDLGRAFLEFMLSEGFQSAIPTGNWMYPVVTPASGLPDGFDPPLPSDAVLPVDPAQVTRDRKAWTEAWLRALAR